MITQNKTIKLMTAKTTTEVHEILDSFSVEELKDLVVVLIKGIRATPLSEE